jgi:hypothetical protein
MSKPEKTKTDLLAAMEDDVRQFQDTLFKALRGAPSAIAKRVGQITRTIKPPAISPREGLTVCALVREPEESHFRAH